MQKETTPFNTFHMKKWTLILVLFILCVIMYIVFSNVSLHQKSARLIEKESWQPYKYSIFKNKKWFESTCIHKMVTPALEDLPSTIDIWKGSSNAECRDLYKIFTQILSVRSQEGKIVIPDEFATKIRNWLGNKEELFKEAHNQKIITFYNEYTREENTFNPIRGKRPMSVPDMPERKYIDQLSRKTQSQCDFCKYKTFTAEDTFGRIDSNFSCSASNAFKLDHWHALFLLKTHHPLNWTKEQFLDLMSTKQKWFLKAHQFDREYKYPGAIWDLLPHAGASQFHPHLHGFLDKNAYQGVMELWRRAAKDYNDDFPGRNYFADIITMHSVLGLTVSYGSAVAFANLVPKRDNEMVIVSEKPDRDFFLLLYFVIRTYLDDMPGNTLCYSSGIAFPSMTGDTSSRSLPVYARLVTRGAVADVRTDVSSLEMFTSANANTDPFVLIKYVKQSIAKRTVTGR